MTKLSYRNDIDGLRALAVIPVLLFHADLGCSGGYVGVDIFFVISGYLITSLIIKGQAAGSFRFTQFWIRRIRRLFPAMAAVVIATAVVGWFVMIPEHLRELGQSIVAQPLLVANFYFWKQTGYFETASEFQPLLHTWSLAVEEQFYLLMPLVLLPLLRGPKRKLMLWMSGIVIASLIWSVWGTARFPSFSFFLIPSRIWELGIGVLLAIRGRKGFQKKGANEVASFLGLGLILYSVFSFDKNTPFPGYTAILPCLGAALLLFANSGDTLSFAGRALAIKPLVWIGKISYSLYLWHWPCLVFLNYIHIEEPPTYLVASALILSAVLAWGTYYFIENPIRRKNILGTKRQLLIPSSVIAVAMIVSGTLFYKTDGFPKRFPPEIVALQHPSGGVPGFYEIKHWEGKNGGPFLMGDTNSEATPIALWGDSHAMAIMPVLDTLGKRYKVPVAVAAQPGVLPAIDTYPAKMGPKAKEFVDKGMGYIIENGIKDVILVARWPIYVYGRSDGKLDVILRDDQTHSTSPSEAEEVFRRNLPTTLKKLSDHGVTVWLMRNVALQPVSVPEALAQIASRGHDLNSLARPVAEHRKFDEPINGLLDEVTAGTSVHLLDPLPYITNKDGIYEMARGGQSLYGDRNHLSPFGSQTLAPLFEPIFEKAAEEGN